MVSLIIASFDEGIGRGHVGFGLVIVVVAHEVRHSVVWEALELCEKLRQEVLFGASTSVGRCTASISFAMV